MTGKKTRGNLFQDFSYSDELIPISGEANENDITVEDQDDALDDDTNVKSTSGQQDNVADADKDKSAESDKTQKKDVEQPDDTSEDHQQEVTLAEGLYHGLFEFLGEKPEEMPEAKNLESFYSYIGQLLEEKQKPKFNSQLAKDIEEAVQKGLSEEEYLSMVFGGHDSIDISSEEGQEKAIREWLVLDGWEKDDIDDEVEDLRDSGRLERKAKLYNKKLEEHHGKTADNYFQQRMQHLEEQQKQAQEQQAAFIQDLKSTREIDGRKLTEKEASDLADWVYKPSVVMKDSEGNFVRVSPYQKLLQDPNFVKTILYRAYKGLSDMDNAKKVSTETKKKIFGFLQREEESKRGVDKSTRKPNISEDFGYR